MRTKITLTGDYEQYKSVGGLTPHQVTGTVSAFGTKETAKDWDSNVDTIDRQKSESGGVSAKIEQDLGFATLVSHTAYSKTHGLPKNQDYDATPIYAVNLTNDLRNRQFTQELQLIGNPGSRLQWQVGAHFLSSRDQVDAYLEGGLLAPALLDVAHARQRTRSLSAYGQGTYKLTDDTRLTLGLRYTKERRKMNGVEIATLPLAGGGTGSGHLIAAFGSVIMSALSDTPERLLSGALISQQTFQAASRHVSSLTASTPIVHYPCDKS